MVAQTIPAIAAKPLRVVVVADSLALPRDQNGDVLLWEETWPYLLQQELGSEIEVINCGARARTADKLRGQELEEHVKYKHPDVIVVQVGITDCSPRVFSKLENRLINLPVVPEQVRSFLIKRRVAKRPEITKRDPTSRVYTKPDKFLKNLHEYCREVAQLDPNIHLIFLPIVSHRERMEQKSPRHSENVLHYNDLLRKVCREHNVMWCDPELLLAGIDLDPLFFKDGYHLTAAGSRLIAAHLVPLIKKRLVPHPRDIG